MATKQLTPQEEAERLERFKERRKGYNAKQKERIKQEKLAYQFKNQPNPKEMLEQGILFLGTANPKQAEFFDSHCLYTAYGGARGGGKSWAIRVKAVGGALTWDGIRILIIRRTYPELQQNHIEPIIKLVPQSVGSYNGSLKTMYFKNGSYIKFGHAQSLTSIETEYQGQEYDWIFLDEATQFTEQEFRTLGGCLRGVNEIPKRFYLTCNPGGIGHLWVKRLFIDRKFKTDSPNPEENENPDDYKFIFASVEDNIALMTSEGGQAYKNMLSALPEKLRRAHRYGDWDAMSGVYFEEFREGVHTCEPFYIPKHWLRYRSFDYGLDMFACYWFAIEPTTGRAYCYREYCQEGLIAKDAAQNCLAATPLDETIQITFAPPDVWNRNRDTGKSSADIFMFNGVSVVKANNDRVQGHLQMKEMLAPGEDGKPMLIFFDTCKHAIGDMKVIQADTNNPSDCAKNPHEITHTVDGVRYFCVSRTMVRAEEMAKRNYTIDDEDGNEADYDDYMTGGEISRGYM